MTESALLSIATTGFIVAFLHAALPTHWLPFVLAGRGQHWSRSQTLLITMFASLGHVAFTTLLGLLVVFVGIEAHETMGEIFPLLTGGLLLLIGFYYIWRQYTGRCGHHHWHKHNHDHAHDHSCDHGHYQKLETKQRSDWAVIGSLFALLTFSPCEAFLPVYLSAIEYGWTGFAILSAILALGTASGMVIFTWLTLIGLERFQLKTLERYEAGILGALLCILGLMVMILEH